MKGHFSLFLLVATLCPQAYSLSSSNPKEIRRVAATKPKSSKASPDISTEKEVTRVVQKKSDPADDTVDAFIRSEYNAWVLQHNKTTDDERFEIFKGNFLATLKAYESTGKYHALNKFADMTPEEYKSAPAPVDDVDAYVKTEYKAWAEQYGKRPGDKRYTIFKENFLMTMKIFEETGKFNALNEHGDMTKEEFIRFQTKKAMAPSAAPSQQFGASSEMPTLPPGPWTFTPVSPRSSSDVMKSSSASSSSEWENQGWSNPPASMPATQANPYSSYSRPSSMTFTPVTPKSTSDVLNNGSSSSSEWGGQQWDEQQGVDLGGTQWNSHTSSSASNSEWGGHQQWRASASSGSSGEWEQQWRSPGTADPARQTTSDSYASYSRPSSMTFTPVTPKSTSDLLNKGSSSSTGGEWGGQERDSSGFGTSYAQPQFSRPSSMTFTPITPSSSSDVLNKGSSSSSGWGGEEWGSSARGSQMSSAASYTASNPSGATFKPITPTSTSDLLNSKTRGGDTTQWGRSSPSSNPGSYSSRSKQGSSKSRATDGFSRTRKSTSYIPESGNGDSSNGSLWDKMASAAMGAFTGATRSSSPADKQTIKSEPSSFSSVRPGQRIQGGLGNARKSPSSFNDSRMAAPYSGSSYLNRMNSGAENFGTPRNGRSL